jgi:hypothetical protein
VVVNTSTIIKKRTCHLKPLNIKQDFDIWRWKFRSFLGTDTNMCAVKQVKMMPTLFLLIHWSLTALQIHE